MANNQIAVYTKQTLEAFSPDVLNVMRQSYAPTATDPEFMMFAHRCAVTGLDPFKNQIFFTKYKSERYGEQVRIMYAEDAYLDKAREKEGFQPPDTQVVRANDTIKVRRDPETKELEIEEHEFSFPRGKIIAAYSIAYRDGYRPVTAFVEMEDLQHMFTGPNKENWNKWTADMISKFVEQRALKKQYGLNFGEDDAQQPAGSEVQSYERKDITEEANQATAASQEVNRAEDEEAKINALKAQMKQNFAKLGLVNKADRDAHMAKHFKIKGEQPTIAEIMAYLKIMDLQIQEKQAALNDELPL